MDTKKIIQYYTNDYEEDDRLERHKIEFHITTYFLNKVIDKNIQLLDAGAGTGVYSIYYAERGSTVTAIDLVPRHIEILNHKLSRKHSCRISSRVQDARDLSIFQAESFDAVLSLGPVCHLEDREAEKCIREGVQVLRNGGILAVSYLNRYTGYESDKYGKLFTFRTREEIQNLFSGYPVELIYNIPTDGNLFQGFQELVEKGTIEQSHSQFQKNEELFSSPDNSFIHGLYIVRKCA